MDDIELKAEFVMLVSHGEEPMLAAMSLYPGDDKKAVEMFTKWTGDAELMDSAAPVAKMKTKEELGELIWSRAKIAEDKDSVNYLKLYAEISGFTSKGQTNFNIEKLGNISNVMKVPVGESVDSFEEKAIKQQMRLIEDASGGKN